MIIHSISMPKQASAMPAFKCRNNKVCLHWTFPYGRPNGDLSHRVLRMCTTRTTKLCTALQQHSYSPMHVSNCIGAFTWLASHMSPHIALPFAHAYPVRGLHRTRNIAVTRALPVVHSHTHHHSPCNLFYVQHSTSRLILLCCCVLPFVRSHNRYPAAKNLETNLKVRLPASPGSATFISLVLSHAGLLKPSPALLLFISCKAAVSLLLSLMRRRCGQRRCRHCYYRCCCWWCPWL